VTQVAHGTFENERTRAAILLAITKLHANVGFIANEKVEQIMKDYKHSKAIEVQTRALDYWVLRSGGITNNLLFNTPLTEK
jgi:hypothetical protein